VWLIDVPSKCTYLNWILLRNNKTKWVRSLTHAQPDWNVSPGSEVGDEDDGDHVPDLVHGRDDAGDAGGDLVALLDGRDHRVQIAGREGLLKGHQEWQQKNENLKKAKVQKVVLKGKTGRVDVNKQELQNTKETEEAKPRYPSAFLFNLFPST